MLWVKAFHIIFMVAWFAGLFYLPRLIVYHAMAEDSVSRERFSIMERKLFVIMSIGGAGTVLFGVWALVAYAWTAYAGTGWLHVKLVLSALLIVYHVYCYALMRELETGGRRHGQVFYRWINEVPTVMLLAMVILVVVKPF